MLLRRLGRKQLRLRLQQQLRLQSQSLLLRFHKITSAPGQMARGVFHFAVFYRRLQDPQVLQKDLAAHEHQDQPAGKFCLSFIPQAEHMAHLYSDGR